jgi:hypothetical protein
MQGGKVDFVKSLLFQGGRATLPVNGGSMRPVLHHRQVVTVFPVSPEALRYGMCCVYLDCHGRLVVHRIIHKSKKHTCIIGDNCSRIETVQPHTILGYVPIARFSIKNILINAVNFVFFPFRDTVIFGFRIRLIRKLEKVGVLCENLTRNLKSIPNG